MALSEYFQGIRRHAAAKNKIAAAVAILIVAATATVLVLIGRTPICACGYVKLWQGMVNSADNSQHISDWYSFSHVIHGFLFYGLTWLVARRLPIGVRLCLALVIECGWEIFENTDFVINRYREATNSLDYYGDSVLNSVCDALFMAVGFFLASRFPIWLTITIAVGLELFTGFMIRDNLTLNILMLVWPLDAIKHWQSGLADHMAFRLTAAVPISATRKLLYDGIRTGSEAKGFCYVVVESWRLSEFAKGGGRQRVCRPECRKFVIAESSRPPGHIFGLATVPSVFTGSRSSRGHREIEARWVDPRRRTKTGADASW